MTGNPSIVLKYGFCEEPTCGTYGVARYWWDGSFQRILPACHHRDHTVCKTTTEIRKAIAKATYGTVEA